MPLWCYGTGGMIYQRIAGLQLLTGQHSFFRKYIGKKVGDAARDIAFLLDSILMYNSIILYQFFEKCPEQTAREILMRTIFRSCAARRSEKTEKLEK